MLKKVLCVDDDPVTLMICKMVIEKACFAKSTSLAANGQLAIDYFASDPTAAHTELVLLDLNMPVMNGWDFLDEFMRSYKARFPTTQVAILSSSVNPEDVQKARSYEIVIDFIKKPLTVEGLEAFKKHEKLSGYFL